MLSNLNFIQIHSLLSNSFLPFFSVSFWTVSKYFQTEKMKRKKPQKKFNRNIPISDLINSVWDLSLWRKIEKKIKFFFSLNPPILFNPSIIFKRVLHTIISDLWILIRWEFSLKQVTYLVGVVKRWLVSRWLNQND